MDEFGFELRLCAALEADGQLVARQLGAGVARPGNRVLDAVVVEPGQGFDARRALTPNEIPATVLDAGFGAGRFRTRRAAFAGLDVHPATAREATDRAVEIGFLERARRGGQDRYRQVGRYPDDWFDRLVGIENKPDLGTPGALSTQLRTDVALGLVDAVILATASHVTRAHLHRLPEPVGVWRVTDGAIEVVREPQALPVEQGGVEIIEEHAGRTDVRTVDAAAKAAKRRRLAERAYGKGWRTYALPGCANAEVWPEGEVDGLPGCGHHGRLVDPAVECGPACPGYEQDEPPAVDLDAARERTSPWTADAATVRRRQAGLDRFG